MATYKPKNYDLVEAFRVIENQLTDSMMRNISKHIGDEKTENFNWSMWQAEQLNALHEYKLQSEKFFNNYSGAVSNEIDLLLSETYKNAQLQTENEILKAIKGGYKTTKSESNFFKISERKLNALMGATKSDFKDATKAMLRTSADEYRRIIFNAQVYANTGAGTVRQAIDMATKDFLSKGINCIEYKNGAKVPIDSYAEMALRTTNTRATLLGEGTKRKEWNVTTVIVTPNASGCPKCLEWVGKVYIDDVWSGGKSKDGAYPLLSTAIEGGLYHPNCRDSHSTYFEGINSKPKPMTAEEKAEASRVYELQQKQRYCERNVRKYKRLAEYSLDPDNKAKYEGLRDKWNGNLNELVKNNPELRLKPERVKTYGIDITKLNWITGEGISKPTSTKIEKHSEIYNKIIEGLKANKVEYKETSMFKKQPSTKEIISRLCGGDRTNGSCSSLAFAYCGNKNGIDVIDFRGGESQYCFSCKDTIKQIAQLPNVKSKIIKVKKEAIETAKIITELPIDKEYYLAVGQHASIIRNTEQGVQYLELQSENNSGWTNFKTEKRTTAQTLICRFKARKTVDKSFGKVWEKEVILIEVDSFKNNQEFKEILGYINTSANKQMKGLSGTIK